MPIDIRNPVLFCKAGFLFETGFWNGQPREGLRQAQRAAESLTALKVYDIPLLPITPARPKK